MRVSSVIRKFIKIIAGLVLAVVALLGGVVSMLYSPWVQRELRSALTAHFDSVAESSSPRISLESWRLRPPLRLELDGLAVTENADTLVAAASARVNVSLLPLIWGKVRINSADLIAARYRLGSPDSLMYMTIAADSIGIRPASLLLSALDINLEQATIRGGRLAMTIRPDTSTVDKAPAPPMDMSIALGRLTLDDFDYSMRLMPAIDTLNAHIGHAVLRDGKIDMLHQHIGLSLLEGTRLDARYVAPDSAAIVAAGPYPPADVPADTVVAEPWTVEIDSIFFDRSHALYTTAGVRPLPGLDFAYIEASDLTLGLKNFYNQASTVHLPLTFAATERCGVRLEANGSLFIDESALTFKNFNVATPEGTDIAFDGLLGMGDMASDSSLPLALRAGAGLNPADMRRMFPLFAPYFMALPTDENIDLAVDVSGTMGDISLDTLGLRLTRCASLSASGRIKDVMQPDRMNGNIALRGRIININKIKNSLLPAATAKTLAVPPMALAGNVTMAGGRMRGGLTARTASGDIRLKADWRSRSEDYVVTVDADRFPVDAFMPLLGVGAVTARIDADGHGYNPFSETMRLDASLAVDNAVYSGHTYTGITGDVHVADGRASVGLSSVNPDLDLELAAEGTLTGGRYDWTADIDGRNVDFRALGFSDSDMAVEMAAHAEAVVSEDGKNINAHVNIADLFLRRESGTVALNDIDMRFLAADSLTEASVVNRDLTARFTSATVLDSLLASFSATSEVLSGQIAQRRLNVDSLQKAMPPFELSVVGGNSNMINDFLSPSGMSVRSLNLFADNDSTLRLRSQILRFKTGSMILDTINVGVGQHAEHLHMLAHVGNRPGTLDNFAQVDLNGRVDGNRAALRLSQRNIKGQTGFDFGLDASVADSTAVVHINPLTPVIGYQPWTVNPGNFINYTIPSGHIDANVRMAGGTSSLAIYTDAPEDSVHIHSHDHQEDLVVKIDDIHIADWISFNPFAPPMRGDLDADMRLNRSDGQIVGRGTLGLENFFYGREKVADFGVDFDVAATTSGSIRAKANLSVDGRRTISLAGTMNDSTATSPLDLDLSMIHFPLSTANPFLPAGTGRLRGMLNGSMRVTGTEKRPVINGTLDFDSTAVRLGMTGTDYRFSEVDIPVEDNVVSFNSFAITACNDNPLVIDGRVNLGDFSDPRFALTMKADNMQIVDSRRASKGADVYGKAFISLNASAQGSMQMMNVDARLALKPGTNVTYVIPDASSVIASQSTGDMVRFVNFTDSLAMQEADSVTQKSMSLFLDALLTIEEGTVIGIDLSADGKNRVRLESDGTLTYAMSPMSDGRLSGRLNINGGYVRYTPPLMSEKRFDFEEGSYVAFNGNMMNPTLNVHASDVIKANVTQEGANSRLVNFDVGLGVTGTLENMNVVFDLSTDDDITVANELQSMSAEQRANQAMNLLLYNVYTGPGTKGNASLSGNPLFSFLESQLNSWMANTVKGVDISFGIDQYDRTVNGSTSSTMSYSYQVSKSLFNDRFKIVVGGNYSTDANVDENFSQNLINDISFEYFLNNTRTMYVRLFRHTGYESILEGEITQTGVGFVYRRKLNRLGDMFHFRRHKAEKIPTVNESD